MSFDEIFRRYVVPRSNARCDLEMTRLTGQSQFTHNDSSTIDEYNRMRVLLERRANEMRASNTFTSYYHLTGHAIF